MTNKLTKETLKMLIEEVMMSEAYGARDDYWQDTPYGKAAINAFFKQNNLSVAADAIKDFDKLNATLQSILVGLNDGDRESAALHWHLMSEKEKEELTDRSQQNRSSYDELYSSSLKNDRPIPLQEANQSTTNSGPTKEEALAISFTQYMQNLLGQADSFTYESYSEAFKLSLDSIKRFQEQGRKLKVTIPNEIIQNLNNIRIQALGNKLKSANIIKDFDINKDRDLVDNSVALVQKAAKLSIVSGDSNKLEKQDLVAAFFKNQQSIEAYYNFIKTVPPDKIVADLKTIIDKLKSYRTNFDAKEDGNLELDKINDDSRINIDKDDEIFKVLYDNSPELKNIVDAVVTTLMGSVGLDSGEITTIKAINEDASDFEISDLGDYFNSANGDVETRKKIKKLLKVAPHALDRLLPAELANLKTAIIAKINKEINKISTNRDWLDASFVSAGSAVPSGSFDSIPSFNLGDLYNVGGKGGQRLSQTFEKVTTLSNTNAFKRIKHLEKYFPENGAIDASITKGGLGEWLAGASISKVLVDAYNSGIETEMGYDLENFLSMIVGGVRTGNESNSGTGGPAGTFDVSFAVNSSQHANMPDASVKSLKAETDINISWEQAISNINSSLRNGPVDYIIASKSDKVMPASGRMQIKFYAVTLLVADNTKPIDKDNINIKRVNPNTLARTDLQRVTGKQTSGTNKFKVTVYNSDYKFYITNDQPFATLYIPSKQDFKSSIETSVNSINSDLKAMFIEMNKFKAAVEDFLIQDDVTKAETAVDSFIGLKDLTNKAFLFKDKNLNFKADDAEQARYSVKGDLEKQSSLTESKKITARYLKKLIEESFKKNK